MITKEEIQELTEKVLSCKDLDLIKTNEIVSWGISLVEHGYDKPSLLILAGLGDNPDYFELMDYFEKTLLELGLKHKEGKEAAESYSRYHINQLAKGIKVKTNLTLMYHFFLEQDHDQLINDFYLLYFAWGDLEHHPEFQTNYWQNVDSSNIREEVIRVAKKWLTENPL